MRYAEKQTSKITSQFSTLIEGKLHVDNTEIIYSGLRNECGISIQINRTSKDLFQTKQQNHAVKSDSKELGNSPAVDLLPETLTIPGRDGWAGLSLCSS